MKFKILKHVCVLFLLSDLILFASFQFVECKKAISSQNPLFSKEQVFYIILQAVIGVCFLIVLTLIYLKENRFSIYFTFLYILYYTLCNTIWNVIPTYIMGILGLDLIEHTTYPFLYPYLYNLVVVIYGVLIYQKKN